MFTSSPSSHSNSTSSKYGYEFSVTFFPGVGMQQMFRAFCQHINFVDFSPSTTHFTDSVEMYPKRGTAINVICLISTVRRAQQNCFNNERSDRQDTPTTTRTSPPPERDVLYRWPRPKKQTYTYNITRKVNNATNP